MKYVILSDSDNVEPFTMPRQLYKINNETIVGRTIRLLKENGIKDILITSHDKRFDNLGAIRYEPKSNKYDGKETDQHKKGYWLNAFPQELLTEPITFLLGDVYYSEEAIKTIVNSDTDKVLFFCTDIRNGKGLRYIKNHDEPLGFKVVDCELFIEHIEKLKDMWDKELTRRHPIAWELYRSINGLDVNKHELTTGYIAINDISCDIDNVEDVKLIEDMSKKIIIRKKEEKMKIRALRDYTDNVLKKEIKKGDEYEVSDERGKQILNHPKNLAMLVEIVKKEVEALEEAKELKEEIKENIEETKEVKKVSKPKTTTKKRTTKKK